MLAGAGAKPPICIFSKHMAQFDYDELGKNAKQIGFDGVDLTVRAKGHVLPENATADLPRAYDAIRKHGLSVPMITTNILRADEPTTRPILRAAGALKIPYWKIGYYRYDLANVEASLEQTRAWIRDLAALSKEYGVVAGIHNHSGDNVGSPIWDTRYIFQDLDPKWIGYYFDPAHATVEGGLGGWRISQALVARRLKMVALKDFYWEKSGGKWTVRWCPIGQGMVDWPKVFSGFAATGFSGPFTLHVEYDPKDELAAIAQDFEFVKKQVAAAYRS